MKWRICKEYADWEDFHHRGLKFHLQPREGRKILPSLGAKWVAFPAYEGKDYWTFDTWREAFDFAYGQARATRINHAERERMNP